MIKILNLQNLSQKFYMKQQKDLNRTLYYSFHQNYQIFSINNISEIKKNIQEIKI